MSDRKDSFANLDDFSPIESPLKPVDRGVIDQIADRHDFPSRAAIKQQAPAMPTKGISRRYKTGRNQQINIKASAEYLERFYALLEVYKLSQAELFERAVEALENTSGKSE